MAEREYAMSRRELNRLAKRVAKERARLHPLLPWIELHDLDLILSRMLRPVEQRRYFIRRQGSMYVH